MPEALTKVIDFGMSEDVIGLDTGRSHGADSFDFDNPPRGSIVDNLLRIVSISDNDIFLIF